MILNLLAIIILQAAVAGLFVMLALDADRFSFPFSYKRNGSLHFVRFGRVSGSFCIRKA